MAWKRGLPGPKIYMKKLSPSLTLSYTTTEKPGKVFCAAKVIEGPETPESPLW